MGNTKCNDKHVPAKSGPSFCDGAVACPSRRDGVEHAGAGGGGLSRAAALGTSRVLKVDAASTPRVGLKSFPQTLPLDDHEVVLTFDDGPWPATTPKVLAALAMSACTPLSS